MERIAHAAIMRTDSCIIFGRDHADCIKRSPEKTCPNRLQGFLTARYRFVCRKEAAKIAFEAGQIDKWKNDDILLSDQLWSPSMGGKFVYDEQFGYVKGREDGRD